jgi:hypothetical protein
MSTARTGDTSTISRHLPPGCGPVRPVGRQRRCDAPLRPLRLGPRTAPLKLRPPRLRPCRRLQRAAGPWTAPLTLRPPRLRPRQRLRRVAGPRTAPLTLRPPCLCHLIASFRYARSSSAPFPRCGFPLAGQPLWVFGSGSGRPGEQDCAGAPIETETRSYKS